jgi:hypothetical protein
MADDTTQTPPRYASETLLRVTEPEDAEDRLMLAVLLDAVALLREHATGVRPQRARLVSDTARWFASEAGDWPLSFVNICRVLGLDASGLRAGLERELTDLGARALLRPGHAEVVVLRPAPTSIRTGQRSARGRS